MGGVRGDYLRDTPVNCWYFLSLSLVPPPPPHPSLPLLSLWFFPPLFSSPPPSSLLRPSLPPSLQSPWHVLDFAPLLGVYCIVFLYITFSVCKCTTHLWYHQGMTVYALAYSELNLYRVHDGEKLYLQGPQSRVCIQEFYLVEGS